LVRILEKENMGTAELSNPEGFVVSLWDI